MLADEEATNCMLNLEDYLVLDIPLQIETVTTEQLVTK